VNINGLSEAVYSKSPHKAAAMKLAAYLSSAEPQKIMADDGYIFPALNGLSQGYVDYWKKKGLDVSPFLEESKGTTFNLPITTGFTAFENKLNQTFNDMYLGKLTPQQAADRAVADGNALVK
jgi:multiple sugar transport system substrate-binding protein